MTCDLCYGGSGGGGGGGGGAAETRAHYSVDLGKVDCTG